MKKTIMICLLAALVAGAAAQTGGLGAGLNKIPTVIPENGDSLMFPANGMTTIPASQ